MKKNLKIAVSCLGFLCLLGLVICKTSSITERKDSYTKYLDFYDQEEDFDVLFLGTSHVLRGIFPMELWNEYGIVSYNMSNNAETLAETYWVLKNSLEYTSPKLVVVDLYKIALNEKISQDEETGELLKGYLHDYMDSVPLSGVKVQAVTDLLPSEDWMEYLFDFSMYHERWSSLGQTDFVLERSCEKGAEAYAGIVGAEGPAAVASNQRMESDTVGKQYLRRIIELCQEKEIEILLTYIPYGGIDKEKRMWANCGYTIAEEYGINYANLLDVDGLMNYDIDCCDSDSHLNVSGGQKVTGYLGAYIRSNYDCVPDRRNDEAYKEWYADYQVYMDEKIDDLSLEADIQKYLLLLKDKSLSCCYYIRPDSEIYEDEILLELLKNLGKIKRLDEARIKNEEYFVLVDNHDQCIYEFVGKEEFQKSVSFGLFEYGIDQEGMRQLHIEYSEDNYLTDSKERPSDLHVLVFDNATGEMVDKARFIMKENMTRKEIKK